MFKTFYMVLVKASITVRMKKYNKHLLILTVIQF